MASVVGELAGDWLRNGKSKLDVWVLTVQGYRAYAELR